MKWSNVNLVNVWGPGYHWSARWRSLVCDLKVDPSPRTSTLCPPDVIHGIGVPKPSPFFALFHTLYWAQTEKKKKKKKRGRPGNEAYNVSSINTHNSQHCWSNFHLYLTWARVYGVSSPSLPVGQLSMSSMALLLDGNWYQQRQKAHHHPQCLHSLSADYLSHMTSC